MRNYLKLIAVVLFYQTSFCQSVVAEKDGFQLLNDFEKNKALFLFDVLDWNDKEGDYGIIYKSNEREYLVFNIEQFREKGRSQFIYLTDKELNFKIVKVIEFTYDKKWDEPDKKVSINTEYF